VESAGANPVPDSLDTDTEPKQLLTTNDADLPAGDPGNEGIRPRRVHWPFRSNAIVTR
jgi:hypothetical protein